MKGRFIILVIDGLGVGAMPDVKKNRPQDKDANTLKHIITSQKLNLPFFEEIGVIDYLQV